MTSPSKPKVGAKIINMKPDTLTNHITKQEEDYILHDDEAERIAKQVLRATTFIQNQLNKLHGNTSVFGSNLLFNLKEPIADTQNRLARCAARFDKKIK